MTLGELCYFKLLFKIKLRKRKKNIAQTLSLTRLQNEAKLIVGEIVFFGTEYDKLTYTY